MHNNTDLVNDAHRIFSGGGGGGKIPMLRKRHSFPPSAKTNGFGVSRCNFQNARLRDCAHKL